MNTQKLVDEMKAKGVTRVHMCNLLGMSRSAFYRKMHGKSEFTVPEMQQIMQILHLESPVGIFYAEEVS